MDVRPTAITADRAARLLNITWQDGQTSAIPFAILIHYCPCEICSMQRNNSVDNTEKIHDSGTEIEAINPVGEYGINLMWKGGCRYGIYRWDYLFSLA